MTLPLGRTIVFDRPWRTFLPVLPDEDEALFVVYVDWRSSDEGLPRACRAMWLRDGRWSILASAGRVPCPSLAAALALADVPSPLREEVVLAMADPGRELLLLQVMDS